jgi:hypothetical protein
MLTIRDNDDCFNETGLDDVTVKINIQRLKLHEDDDFKKLVGDSNAKKNAFV